MNFIDFLIQLFQLRECERENFVAIALRVS
jgi:hypothetical protein